MEQMPVPVTTCSWSLWAPVIEQTDGVLELKLMAPVPEPPEVLIV